MFDTAAIAARIREERKLTKRLSQEAMAADIGLHQADVKNLKVVEYTPHSISPRLNS